MRKISATFRHSALDVTMNRETEHEVPRRDEGRKEALKTFIEQTKILITLASGFVLAPPAVLSFLRKPAPTPSPGCAVPLVPSLPWERFNWAEGLLVASILFGYLVLSTIAGSQHQGNYDVHRPMTRLFSVLQIVLYLVGVILFLTMIPALL
jgi:hypothetical protein